MHIYHNSQDSRYRKPFGAVPCKAEVTLRLDVKDECPSSVWLRTWCGDREELHAMTLSDSSDAFVYTIKINMPDTPCLFWYYFIIDTNSGVRFRYVNNQEGLGGEGICASSESDKSYQITVYDSDFTTPDWFKGRIMYQIFPDRFCGEHKNGKISKSREEYIIHYNRYEHISFNPHPYESGPACNDFYGGNLKGITKKLPYIKSLGVGVIYLNPIFEAYSNHKYDTADYKKIDPMFGDESDFAELCREAEKLDIRIILDGVFSHTGADSIYFNKYGYYGNGGAYRDVNSPYRKWYCFDGSGSYESWWGCSNLPNVNEMEPSYLDYILRDDDSVIKKWLRLGASGWRLDVADELPDEFISILRSEVKKVKPDAVIIGEVWEDASNKVAYSKQREYLLGHELDSVMNYPFKDDVTAYIMGNISAGDMNRRLMSIMENYPKQVFYSLMNLLGTHDTMRIKSLFGGLSSDCGDTRLESGMEELATYRVLCAVFMQMTMVGVPSIYYGDEIGMQGGRDPFNRAPFTWHSVDPALLENVIRLSKLRSEHKVLQTGYFKTLIAKDAVFVFARYFKNKKDAFGNVQDNSFAICAVNRSFEPQSVLVDISEFRASSLMCGIDNPRPISAKDGYINFNIPPVGYVYIEGKIK